MYAGQAQSLRAHRDSLIRRAHPLQAGTSILGLDPIANDNVTSWSQPIRVARKRKQPSGSGCPHATQREGHTGA
jgi:hypothetical protein